MSSKFALSLLLIPETFAGHFTTQAPSHQISTSIPAPVGFFPDLNMRGSIVLVVANRRGKRRWGQGWGDWNYPTSSGLVWRQPRSQRQRKRLCRKKVKIRWDRDWFGWKHCGRGCRDVLNTKNNMIIDTVTLIKINKKDGGLQAEVKEMCFSHSSKKLWIFGLAVC